MATSESGIAEHDPAALEAAAAQAMRAGDAASCARLLEAARDAGASSLVLELNLAAVYRRLGRLDDALAATDAALRLNPRDFTALLLRASLIEKQGHVRAAAAAYGDALTQAPADLDVLNEATRRATLHARDLYARHQAEMTDAIAADAQAALARCTPGEAQRVQRFIDDLTGRRKRYRQEPAAFFYSGLPAIEFYPRDAFAWLEHLEAATPEIAAELDALIEGDGRGFTPYVDYDDSLPLDQWRALNRSPDWSAFHLFFSGKPIAENCARCPATLAALSRVPQPQVPGRSPAAMFSVLKPHTRIPPHTGVSNTRLVCHLPLIVPPDCRFRVGNETRAWERGRAWVFDDTLEHEAVNDSDRDRIILIFDVAQPAISAAEHAAISDVAQALDAFGGAPIAAVL
jgi:aspartate beta-hydroxylase